MASPADISLKLPLPYTDSIEIRNFIGGKWYAPSSNSYFDNYSPSTGKVISQIPDSNAADVDLAVQAATDAFPRWSALSTQQRAAHIHKLADLIEENLETMAQFETMDQGKTLTMSRNVDIARTATNFRYYANYVLGNPTEPSSVSTYIKPFNSAEGLPISAQALSYTNRSPVGVAGLISPWNLPLYLLSWKIAPCIAAGNTCVCKPSEFTSITAMMLTRLVKQAGIPDGVINIVFGLGSSVGNSLVTHPKVPLISFTGGTITGKKIAAAAAPMFKHISLELGGKNPALIFDDANLDECIPTTVRGSFQNQGEICLCSSRIYVQRSIYDEFVARFKDYIRNNVIVGDPTDQNSFYGALVSKPHFEKVQSVVQKAQSEGAHVEFCVDLSVSTHIKSIGKNGSLQVSGLEDGYFMAPTVITDVDQSSTVVQEEIFGPVVVILPFDTEQEAIHLANDVVYGLAATVWSLDQAKLRRVSSQIVAGTVWCNCWMVRNLDMPFGGFKASGVGTEGGGYSIDFFTKKQTVCLG
ncbi:hypothetical protein BB561_004330 [Smittium simulii]|uniref:Aldehyde dehydrogenase domain-containing protein n=1 Tax=Smittium simulii TaxID=133385 RepID=A0A2T9YGX7_9FUNG|nr:hypothetical protein BB561_004330 [Smittium simulii]